MHRRVLIYSTIINGQSKVNLWKNGLENLQANRNCPLSLNTVLGNNLVEIFVLIFHLKAILDYLEVIDEIIHMRNEIEVGAFYFLCFNWSLDGFGSFFLQADQCFGLLDLLWLGKKMNHLYIFLPSMNRSFLHLFFELLLLFIGHLKV